MSNDNPPEPEPLPEPLVIGSLFQDYAEKTRKYAEKLVQPKDEPKPKE